MLGNFVLLQRRLTLVEVITVCVIVAGFVGVALGDFRGRNDFEWLGIAAVFGALALEAVAINMEEKLLSDWQVPQGELMAILFPVGSAVTGALALFSGQFDTAFEKVLENPSSLLYILLYSATGAIGLHFVFFSVAKFGCLQTVLFTSLRKSISGFFAFLFTTDLQFTRWHRISWLLLGSGVTVNLYTKLTEGKVKAENQSEGLLNLEDVRDPNMTAVGDELSESA
jgi:drug/metabolite transporter (DMT)-like permease